MNNENKKEAPEKIYVQLPSRKWIGKTWNETPIKEGDNPNWKNATNIEYTRTDVFINKAVKCIEEIYNHHHIMRYSDSCEPPLSELTEWFKNYMKGE